MAVCRLSDISPLSLRTMICTMLFFQSLWWVSLLPWNLDPHGGTYAYTTNFGNEMKLSTPMSIPSLPAGRAVQYTGTFTFNIFDHLVFELDLRISTLSLVFDLAWMWYYELGEASHLDLYRIILLVENNLKGVVLLRWNTVVWHQTKRTKVHCSRLRIPISTVIENTRIDAYSIDGEWFTLLFLRFYITYFNNVRGLWYTNILETASHRTAFHLTNIEGRPDREILNEQCDNQSV